jgi:hypothetical protein
MKASILTVLLFLTIAWSWPVAAQNSPHNAGRFEQGNFVLTVDLRWDQAQQKEFAHLYNLDSVEVKLIFEGRFKQLADSTAWTPRLLRPGVIELSRALAREASTGLDSRLVLFEDFDPKGTFAKPEPAVFGTNKLSREGVIICRDGRCCFFLPGNREAKKVYLSGSFNQWSTRQQPMQKVDSGWISCIDLEAGKYLYKFIVDGKWQHDPNNRLKEKDGHRGSNSVMFAENHMFRLKGHDQARRVIVSGSFNNWNEKELLMRRVKDGWELPVFLGKGTHAYKFIVDGAWITDPENPNFRPDGRNNLNSFLGIGDTLMFSLKGFQDARKVVLSGTFNNWNRDELLMEKTPTGWEFPYVLGPGNYEYKFIVDGRWMTDPANPITNGEGDFANSFISFKPNHIFRLAGRQDAKGVIVSGSFNNWSHHSYRMIREGNDWVLHLHLSPGRYSYKFVVDGKWIPDEANPLWEENEFGTGNSVVWIK